MDERTFSRSTHFYSAPLEQNLFMNEAGLMWEGGKNARKHLPNIHSTHFTFLLSFVSEKSKWIVQLVRQIEKQRNSFYSLDWNEKEDRKYISLQERIILLARSSCFLPRTSFLLTSLVSCTFSTFRSVLSNSLGTPYQVIELFCVPGPNGPFNCLLSESEKGKNNWTFTIHPPRSVPSVMLLEWTSTTRVQLHSSTRGEIFLFVDEITFVFTKAHDVYVGYSVSLSLSFSLWLAVSYFLCHCNRTIYLTSQLEPNICHWSAYYYDYYYYYHYYYYDSHATSVICFPLPSPRLRVQWTNVRTVLTFALSSPFYPCIWRGLLCFTTAALLFLIHQEWQIIMKAQDTSNRRSE